MAGHVRDRNARQLMRLLGVGAAAAAWLVSGRHAGTNRSVAPPKLACRLLPPCRVRGRCE